MELNDEDYPPIDGAYQNRTYFAPLTPSQVRGGWRRTARLIREGKAPSDIGLYVHWPYCVSRCSYCYCDARAPGRGEGSRLLESILLEMAALAPALGGLPLAQVMVAGGTPTSAGAASLDRLLAEIRSRFALREAAPFTVEATPSTLDEAVVSVLLRRGVTRVDLGLDSLDDAVLKKVERLGQDRAGSRRALDLLARSGRFDVGVSLLFGMQDQSGVSFLRDLGWVLRRAPQRVLLYGFDERPQTPVARRGVRIDASRRAEIRALVRRAGTVLEAAGYRANDRGWAPASSLLGIGPSAMSHAFGSLWYQHAPLGESRLSRAAVPPFFGLRSSLDEEMRGHVVRRLHARGEVPLAEFRDLFGRDFSSVASLRSAAAGLAASGAAVLDGSRLRLAAPEPARRAQARARFYGPRVRSAIRKIRPSAPPPGLECLSYARGETSAR